MPFAEKQNVGKPKKAEDFIGFDKIETRDECF